MPVRSSIRGMAESLCRLKFLGIGLPVGEGSLGGGGGGLADLRCEKYSPGGASDSSSPPIGMKPFC